MRIVPGARPVCSATSLIASPFTACAPYIPQFVASCHELLPLPTDLPGPGSNPGTDPGYVHGGMRDPEPILLTGASGYVGSHLLDELRLARPQRARDGAQPGARPAAARRRRPPRRRRQGARGPGGRAGGRPHALLPDPLDGGPRGRFAARDREAAVNVGEAARDAGVERIATRRPGAEASSEHLRSRAEVAELLRARVPELIHARAAMIIGPGSASFEILQAPHQAAPRS